MADTVNIKIKANGDSVIEELKKIGITVDSLKGKSKTITINTNADVVTKAIDKLNKSIASLDKTINIRTNSNEVNVAVGKLSKSLANLNKRVNVDVSLKDNISSRLNAISKSLAKIDDFSSKQVAIHVTTTGVDETLAKLQGVLAVVRELKSNSKINIALGSTGGVGNGSTSRGTRTNTAEAKEQYQTLAKVAKEAALEAEKAWGTKAFAPARESFIKAMDDLTAFKSELGKSSISSSRGVYANMAMAVGKDSPLYDDLVTKIKSLNVEQQKYNELIGRTSGASSPTTKTSIPKETFNNLRTEAVSAAKALDDAFKSGKGVESAKEKLDGALNSLVNFKRASGSMSLGSEANLYAAMLPSVQKSGQAYNALLGRITSVKAAQLELNKVMGNNTKSSSGVKSGSEGINPLNDPANVLQNIARMSKGTGSAGEVIGRQLFNLEKMPGAIGEAATAAASLTAVFATVGLAVYGVYSAITSVAGVLETIGGLVEKIVAPGLKFNANIELMTNGLAGAIASIGQIGDKQVSFNDALGVSTKLMKQLSIDALKIGVKPEELTGTFRSILEPGLQAGMTFDQTRQMASVLTSVGKEMGLNDTTLSRDAADIIMGQNASRTKLGRQLGITDADIAAAKASAGGLFAYLQDRMSGYAESNTNLTNTLSGAWAQLQGYFTLASASLTTEFMPAILGAIKYAESLLGTIKQGADGEDVFIPSENVDKLKDAFERLAVYVASCIDFIIVFAESMTGSEDPVDAVVGLIEDMIGFVVLATTSLITFGNFCINVFERIAGDILGPIAFFDALYNSIMAAASAVHALWDAMSGDMEGKNALNKQAEAYGNTAKDLMENGYGNKKNNDLLRGQSQGAVTQAVKEAINAAKNTTAKSGTGINPNDITTRFPPDDSKQRIADSKKASELQIALLKENLADQLDYYKRHMDEIELIFKQNAMSIDEYFKQKTQTDTAEAQARVDEIQAEMTVVANQVFKDPRDQQKALAKLGKDLNKYTQQLNDTLKATSEIASIQKDFYQNMEKLQDVNGGTSGESTQAVAKATTQLEQYGSANGGVSKDIIDQIVSESIKYGVDPKLATALMMQESGGNQNAVSPAGAVGLFQLMPETAQGMGVNPYDQNQNITGGIQYLRDQLIEFGGDVNKTVAAYNAGSQAVKDGRASGYTETQNYVSSVQDKMNTMSDIPDIRVVMSDYIKEQSANLMTNASKAMDEGFKEGFDNNNGKTMENAREGCVEAVTKIGQYYNKFLNDELSKGVVDTDTLRADASRANIPEIPFNHDKLTKGDVVVYDNGAHVLIYEGNDKVFGNSSSANQVKEQPLYQGQTPTSQIQTGISSIADNYLNISTLATTQSSMKAKEAYAERINQVISGQLSYFSLFGQGALQEKLKERIDLQKQIDVAQADHNDKLVGQLRVVLAEKTKDIDTKYLKANLDLQVKDMQMSAVTMAAKIGLGIYDITAAINKYYEYVNSSVKTVYTMVDGKLVVNPIRNELKDTIDALEDQMAAYQASGRLKEFFDVKASLDKVNEDLANTFKSFIQKIDDQAKFKTSLIDNNQSLTTGQKTELKTRIDKEKLDADLVAEREELRNKTATLQDKLSKLSDQSKIFNTSTDATTKNTAGSYMAILKSEINSLSLIDIPGLQQTIQLNEQLATIPQTLDRIKIASKQSLEDGMNTFLTDGINNAKTLGDAFDEMVISILKSIQKIFADNLTKDIMKHFFPNDYKTETPTTNIAAGLPSLVDVGTNSTPTSGIANYNPLSDKSSSSYVDLSKIATTAVGDTSSLGTSKSTINTAMSRIDNTVTSIVSRIAQTAQSTMSAVSSLSTAGTTASTSNDSGKYTFGRADLASKFATGGIVGGSGTDTSDNVPTMLSPGEGIITAPMVRKLGAGFIHATNRGEFSNIYAKVPKFATGGIVGEVGAQTTAKGLTSFAGSIGNNVSTTANLNVALVKNQDEAIEHFMRSGKGQKVMVDMNRTNSKVISRLIR